MKVPKEKIPISKVLSKTGPNRQRKRRPTESGNIDRIENDGEDEEESGGKRGRLSKKGILSSSRATATAEG